MEKAQLEQARTNYNHAKRCIKENNPISAREYVLDILSLYKIFYSETHPSEKKSIFNSIKTWLKVSEDLRTEGITDYVLSVFALSKADIFSNNSDWKTGVFQEYVNAVVRVKCANCDFVSNGTGFFISNKGYFLTNEHVIFDADRNSYFEKSFLSFYQDTLQFPFSVIVTDKENDIALCKVELDLIPSYISFVENIEEILPGAELILIGNSFGLDLCPSYGTIRYVSLNDNKNNLISTVPSNQGDSGGPILLKSGKCVGINKSVIASLTRSNHKENVRGFTNATRSDVILSCLKEWKEKFNLDF